MTTYMPGALMSDQELIEEARKWPRARVGPAWLINELADALEAHQPRVIGTVEELDTLPVGSVILAGGTVHHRQVDTEIGETEPGWFDLFWNSGAPRALPATVLFVPREETTP